MGGLVGGKVGVVKDSKGEYTMETQDLPIEWHKMKDSFVALRGETIVAIVDRMGRHALRGIFHYADVRRFHHN